jgi:hypothetical protein
MKPLVVSVRCADPAEVPDYEHLTVKTLSIPAFLLVRRSRSDRLRYYIYCLVRLSYSGGARQSFLIE